MFRVIIRIPFIS